MAFLRSITSIDPPAGLHGKGVYLRAPQMSDFAQWEQLRRESKAFLTPWEPTWSAEDLTRHAFRRRVRIYTRDIRQDESYPFFIFDGSGENLLGGLTLANVRRGVTQSCSLGYWLGVDKTGNGHMTAAITAIIPFVFRSLRLHRLEAACLPVNRRSIRLLERTGFSHEGLARRYLCINGVWQDHLLFARLEGDPDN